MDRNQAIGLILISIMLIVYFQYFAPQPEPVTEPTTNEQINPATTVPQQEAELVPVETVNDSLIAEELKLKFGVLAPLAAGTESVQTLENGDIKIDISTKGGQINEVLLKDYLTYNKDALYLVKDGSSSTSIFVNDQIRQIDLQELYYEVTTSKKSDTTLLILTARLNQSQFIKQTYSLPSSGFQLGYDLEMVGFNNLLIGDPIYYWDYQIRHVEKDVIDSRTRTTVNYYTESGDFDGLSERDNDFTEDQVGSTNWIANKQHFFTSAIIADNFFRTARVSTEARESVPDVVKFAKSTLTIPKEDLQNKTASFTYFFGPNNYQLLKKVAPKFDRNIYLGWPPVSFVNKWVIIPIFNLLENYIANYGLIIIILVLVIKLFLSPLSYKSYVSMAKTKVLKPELDEIKEQFPDDMQKQQQEQMKLYQQVGVNPLSGCIPVLLQMPILFAMFYFFPSSIELRQQSFLWADDLSTYDSILNLPFTIPVYGDHVSLFTLLMTASSVLYTWSNNQASTVQGPMKTMTLVMPVIFMFVLNSFPAALSFYYFVSNLVTFGQQSLIRRFVDDEKIRGILDENKKRNKNKKKSKFQARLEEAMKSAEEQKRNRKK